MEAGESHSVRGAVRPAPAVVVAYGSDPDALQDLCRRVHPGVRLVITTDPGEVPVLSARERATLVVLDISSAEGAAWQAAHRIKESPQLLHTPVLLLPSLSASSDGGTSVGIDLGWISLVPKPFTPQQLTDAVEASVHIRERGNADETVCSVLIVDDDADTRRIAANFLKGTSADVREAEDGQRALVEMRRAPPDVVVLDLMMPVLDGFSVIEVMRADPVLASIPVIVLTAKSVTDRERRFLAGAAVRVFQKGSYSLADVATFVLRAARGSG